MYIVGLQQQTLGLLQNFCVFEPTRCQAPLFRDIFKASNMPLACVVQATDMTVSFTLIGEVGFKALKNASV